MKISKRLSNIVVLIIAVVLLCFYFWKGQKHTEIIQKDMQFTSGKVVECKVDHRASVWIKYTFLHNNEYYIKEQSVNINLGAGNLVINKNFPVVFSNKKPEINEMLIFPKDFERYSLQYPDSLKWVKKLLK